MNYWPAGDGILEPFEDRGSSEVVARRSPARPWSRRSITSAGSPETVAQKIATNLRALAATRFDLKYGMPGLTRDQLMTNIELYGRQVIPRVRELLS